MNRAELQRLIVGPIATVPTPFDDDFEVDFGRMAELTRYWVDGGLTVGNGVIKVAAMMGEGPQLSDQEWPQLLRTVVQAANGRATIMCGIHYKDTKRTIEDAKRAADLGAIGLQISPPIFNDPTQDDILRYFHDVSAAIDVGIMVYNNPWLPHGNVDVATFEQMADFEQVVAIKWANGNGVAYEEMTKLTPRFNILDNTCQPGRCLELGGHGYINLTSDVYPPHDQRIWALLKAGRYGEAQALFSSVDTPLRRFYAKVVKKSGGQGRLKKGMLAVMGLPCGASRPPSQPLDAAELAELRDLLKGFGWPVRT